MNSPLSQLKLPCQMEEIDRFLSAPQEGAIDTLRNLEGDILVLGAGGKMGLHLSLLLKYAVQKLGQNNRIWAASRFHSLNGKEAYERHGVETLAGDFRDSSFSGSLPKCPTVFYLIGAKFGTKDNPELLHEINVELAAQLASQFRDSKIVAFSTGCVYSYVTPESRGSHEASPTDPVGEYAISCLEREKRFEEASAKSGTPVALIRLNYSVEFRYGVLLDVGEKVMNGKPVDITMGHFNLIWQNDALNQIVQTLEIAQSPALSINITGPDIVSIRDLAERFGSQFGKKPLFIGKEAPTTWLSDASRSHVLFGKPSVSLQTMIEWTAAWLNQGGITHGKPTGFERRDGRF